jgi:hypothetical protein
LNREINAQYWSAGTPKKKTISTDYVHADGCLTFSTLGLSNYRAELSFIVPEVRVLYIYYGSWKILSDSSKKSVR